MILETSDQLLLSESDLNPCQLVEMDVSICRIYWASQLLFSLHFLVWNLLVAVVLVSVARTQVAKARSSSSRKTCHLLDDQHSEVSSRAGARCDPSWSSTACQLWETSLKQSGNLCCKTLGGNKKDEEIGLIWIMQDNLKNYVWTDDDHIADVFDETKTQPAGENGNQQPRRASSGSSSNFNVRTTLIGPCNLMVWKKWYTL